MPTTQDCPPKPLALAVVPEGIPDELKGLPCWVAWHYNWDGRRWRKVPIRCQTGRPTSIKDPANCTTFDTAFRYYRRRGKDGIGFAFLPGQGYCGVDLDDCRDPVGGEVEPWAQDIIRELASYTEVSPSGTGVKVFLRGKVPGDGRKKKGSIEMYDQGRYFTMTGHRLPEAPREVEDRDAEVGRLWERTFGAGGRVAAAPGCPPGGDMTLADEELIAVAMRAANGKKFARLWAGDVAGYTSESEADLALCNILAFYAGPDPHRVERLFSASGLGKREKWLWRPDYRDWTVSKALAGRTVFYRRARRPWCGEVNQRKQDDTELPGTHRN